MFDDQICGLATLLGEEVRCEGDSCPFWLAGDGCIFERARAELAGRADVASVLVDVRDRLAAERGQLEQARLAAFAHALNKTAQHELD